MRLVYLDEKSSWAIMFQGAPVAVGGTMYFEDREAAAAEISKRGLLLDEDGSISKPTAPPAPEPEKAPETAAEASESPEQPVRRPRGRPRTFTPEEAAERRRAQNREYYRKRKEERKREVAERSKKWWQEHPDKVREYREKANARRRERYANDPEFRARVAASNRAYAERRRSNNQQEAG